MTTHYLAIPQPTAWAVLSGHLEAVNYTLRPPEALLGQRVGIWGEALDEAWWVVEGWGVKLPRSPQGGLEGRCKATGWLGTAELVGYLLKAGGKVTGQQRGDGETTQLRTRKGVVGPVAWILRKPRWGEQAEAKRIRPDVWETREYRERILCYAEQHGLAGLADHHREIAFQMGYRVPQKETAECPSESRIEPTF